jgi:hypothetical protein
MLRTFQPMCHKFENCDEIRIVWPSTSFLTNCYINVLMLGCTDTMSVPITLKSTSGRNNRMLYFYYASGYFWPRSKQSRSWADCIDVQNDLDLHWLPVGYKPYPTELIVKNLWFYNYFFVDKYIYQNHIYFNILFF